MELFDGILAYIRKTGAHIATGHTMELNGQHYRFRAPIDGEYFLNDTPGDVLVLEPL